MLSAVAIVILSSVSTISVKPVAQPISINTLDSRPAVHAPAAGVRCVKSNTEAYHHVAVAPVVIRIER